jgi:hypothetical protein
LIAAAGPSAKLDGPQDFPPFNWRRWIVFWRHPSQFAH